MITLSNTDGSWVCCEQGPLRPIIAESDTIDGAITAINECFSEQYHQAESLTNLSMQEEL